MSLSFPKPEKKEVGFLRFKKQENHYLITTDIGAYSFLTPLEFDAFLKGRGALQKIAALKFDELKEKGFIRNNLNFEKLAQDYAHKNKFLESRGPGLHIIVLTLRCDHKCLYCQTTAQNLAAKNMDMEVSTARQIVNRIFESPRKDIVIEFQGGEPLINWDTARFIIDYATSLNKNKKKKLFFTLVSNFSFMTGDRLKFLIDNNVALCTSLDGPENLHNAHRKSSAGNNSHKRTIAWIKKIQKIISEHKKYKYKINALTTITKSSLNHPEEIIDEFIQLGFEGIHLRPISPFGIKKNYWKKTSYSSRDFLEFYNKALNHIIDINAAGTRFYERGAKIFLKQILTQESENFLDLRSPCGAGIGQLAYNYNGDVYTCDEGRMLSRNKNELFKIGNVSDNNFYELLNHETVKSLCVASCLDNLPGCSDCAYKPYCGVCPIYNYVVEGNIVSKINSNQRCQINKGILDILFKKIQDKKNKDIFLSWLKN